MGNRLKSGHPNENDASQSKKNLSTPPIYIMLNLAKYLGTDTCRAQPIHCTRCTTQWPYKQGVNNWIALAPHCGGDPTQATCFASSYIPQLDPDSNVYTYTLHVVSRQTSNSPPSFSAQGTTSNSKDFQRLCPPSPGGSGDYITRRWF